MPLHGHMQNFFDCIASRETPISDVRTHHRSATACHLANIAMRLDRELQWNPDAEDFIDDPDATAMLSRDQRTPYEIEV